MQDIQMQLEKEIAKDISLSFWPFPPEDILAIGEETARLGIYVAKEIPSCHVTLLASKKMILKNLDLRHFSERISIISDNLEQFDSGQKYSLILTTKHFRPLANDSRLSRLSCFRRLLKKDGRVMALEIVENDDRSSFLSSLEQMGGATGFYDVTVSAMEGTSWSAILFQRQRDFLRV